MDISASGLTAQTARMRVIAQNLANANTTPSSPTEKPYQRQIVTFRNVFDRVEGAHKVAVAGVTKDKSPFGKRYEPTNPAADKSGYVQTPNVAVLVETMDMRAAQRNYEANLTVIEASRTMMARTLDLLK
ncbi:MAG: flagellar basal body rod protein FlgC [Alphaproteobacteria bacterium]